MNLRIGILLLAAAVPAFTSVTRAGSRAPERSRNGMVVSAHGLASQVGADILRRGGNAVDAAVATGFALAVVYPSAGNIGGGGFLIWRSAPGDVRAFDFREAAPARAHPRMFLDSSGVYQPSIHQEGYRSVGVPGSVAGLFLAHQALGSLPMEDLIEPAIELAEDGFPVSWGFHDDLVEMDSVFLRYPESARVFRKPGAGPYQPEDIFRQPDLAKSLRRIRDDGRDGFYRGETARLLVQSMERNGGWITLEDLASYRAQERTPIAGTYRGVTFWSMPPPSSGGITLALILNMLEGFDLRSAGHHSASHVHLLTESMRRAYSERARYLGDPEANPDMPIQLLTSKEHAAALRRTIDPARATASNPLFPEAAGESNHTTHYSVIDAAGNAVAVTTTLEEAYGSGIVAEGTGFLLNNQMGDFNAIPGTTDSTGLIGTPPNVAGPGKRMLSSMTPTIAARDSDFVLSLGSPGGRTIIATVAQVFSNVVDFSMDIGEAIAASRVHHQWFPDLLRIERRALSPDTRSLLGAMGHTIVETQSSRSQGSAMVVMLDLKTGIRHGAADPRQGDGAAVGH